MCGGTMAELSNETIDQLATVIVDRIAAKIRIQDPVLSREDAANFLAVTTRTLDQLARDGELTRVKLGTRTVFQVSDLHELIARKSENAR